jgi:hypothetical protein
MKSGTVCWPNGSRIAIAITVMFETWPDDKWPPYAAQRWQPKPGAKDHQSMTWGQYGGKAGIWRILRILDECGAPATFCVNTFDYLYAREPLSLLVMTVHCHFGGRPLMSAMLDKLLRYFAQFPGVWFARHRELARWALEGDADEITNAERFFPSAPISNSHLKHHE